MTRQRKATGTRKLKVTKQTVKDLGSKRAVKGGVSAAASGLSVLPVKVSAGCTSGDAAGKYANIELKRG